MEKYLQNWDKIIQSIKNNSSDDIELHKLLDSLKIHKIENGIVYIITPDVLTKYRLEKFHAERISKHSFEITGEKYRHKFVTQEDIDKENEEKNQIPLVVPTQHTSGRKISSIYTFSNFVVGESNRFAFLSSTKVADTQEKLYNPLYIFGDVGLGKTHLMTAIGNYILDNNPGTNVVYVSSQKFAEEYFLATSGRRGDIEDFYNKYNSADILLVDDIQFLKGKTATQEEFFKIFEHLVAFNKQIVLTSDRPANDLENIMSRLKSRFNWGVAVNIKSPDKSLRVSILKSKLKVLIPNPNDVSDEILEMIADLFPSNIRDLEGALRSYVTYCVCMNTPFNIDNLYISLENLIPKDTKTNNEAHSNIEKVISKSCDHFKISRNDLFSSSRKQQIAYARQLVMYILSTNYNIPQTVIGDNVGGRDRSTVAHAIDRIGSLIKTDQMIKNDYDTIIKCVNK